MREKYSGVLNNSTTMQNFLKVITVLNTGQNSTTWYQFQKPSNSRTIITLISLLLNIERLYQ